MNGYVVSRVDYDALLEKKRALERELAMMKMAFPYCDKHKPTGGARANCLICGIMELSAALSQIDYACGEPNEMQVSGYDVFCDPFMVVEHVQALAAKYRGVKKLVLELAESVDNAAEDIGGSRHQLDILRDMVQEIGD